MTAVWTGIALGLDNFAVALALGTLGLPRARRRAIAAAFGVCEALGVLLGAVAGAALDIDRASALTAGLALTTVGAMALSGAPAAGRQARVPWLIAGLPLCLALDNVVAGAGLGWSASLAAGVASAAVAVAGLELGAGVARRFPGLAATAAALVLCALGLSAVAAM